MADQDTTGYRADFSEHGLWDKFRGTARIAGKEVLEKAMLLYLVLRDPTTPRWAKTTIIGALGYFIAPIDAIPDLIPGAGFTDDLGVLALALTTVAASVTPKMRRIATRTVERWLGGETPDEDGPLIEVESTVVNREPS